MCLLGISHYAWVGVQRTVMDMYAPLPVYHRIFGRTPRKYKIMRLVLNYEIMVHGTYHPSLTGGSFIIDKTHVQYS